MGLVRRIPRELGKNWSRYFAMSLLIVLMLTTVVGLAGASDSVSVLLDQTAEEKGREDGGFKLFVPLSTEQKQELSEKGITLEEKYSVDLPYKEESTVRIYKNRGSINQVTLDVGREAQEADEIVLEKHFAEAWELKQGDTITLSNQAFRIVGIGSLPDYTDVIKNKADVMSAPAMFGVGLVDYSAFEDIKAQGIEVSYEYSYQLEGNTKEEILRQYLQDMKFDRNQVTNIYMKDVIKRAEDKRVKMVDAINKLSTGSGQIQINMLQLSSGLREFASVLSKEFGDGSELLSGASELRDGTAAFSEGITTFTAELSKLAGNDSELIQACEELKRGTMDLAQGMSEYAKAIGALVGDNSELYLAASEAAQGAGELANGVDELAQAINEEVGSEHELAEAANQVNEGAAELSTEMNGFAESIQKELGSNSELATATQELRSGCDEVSSGMQEFAEAIQEVFGDEGELLNALDELQAGSAELTEGIGSFLDGIEASFGSTSEVVTAANELSNGASELFAGINEYDSGVKEYRKEVLDFIEKEMNVKYFNIIDFTKAIDNSRITACQDETDVYKMIILFIGTLTFLLIGYMMAIFTKNHIEKESVIIGTLYSMGYSRGELLRHYLSIPLVLSVVSSIIGTFLGTKLIPIMTENTTGYYSLPQVTPVLQPYLLGLGLLMPAGIILLINLMILNRRLNVDPLQLLRKSHGDSKASRMEFGRLGFIPTFRLRQLFREIGGNITMMCGLTIAILMMTLAFTLSGSFDAYIQDVDKDIHFEYQYIMSYPMKLEEIPEEGMIAYTESLSTVDPIENTDVDVAVQGITGENQYFPFAEELNDKVTNQDEHSVYISSSANIKFGWDVGDEIYLKNKLTDQGYLFKVKEVVDYSGGFYLFMDIDNMRKVFGEGKSHFNTLFSGKSLEIEPGRLETIITRDAISKSAVRLYEEMELVIDLVVIVSVILFVIVMYLLMKMMTGKAVFSISLLKVMGYKEREVRKIYLGSGLYTVLLTMLIALPVSYQIVKQIFPYAISALSIGMPMVLQLERIGVLVAIILGSYFVVNILLGIYLNRISFTEVLKERE